MKERKIITLLRSLIELYHHNHHHCPLTREEDTHRHTHTVTQLQSHRHTAITSWQCVTVFKSSSVPSTSYLLMKYFESHRDSNQLERRHWLATVAETHLLLYSAATVQSFCTATAIDKYTCTLNDNNSNNWSAREHSNNNNLSQL